MATKQRVPGNVTLDDHGTPLPPTSKQRNWWPPHPKPPQWIPTPGFHACDEELGTHVPCLTLWDDDGVMVQHRCVEHHGYSEECHAAYKQAFDRGLTKGY